MTWDRSNPYEGPTPCTCGHDYGKHCGNDALNSCMVRGCECEAFALVGYDDKETLSG